MRIKIAAVMLFFVFAAFVPVYAHAPSDVRAFYDTGTGKIRITVPHNVKDPKKHFINKISIRRSGKEIASKDFTEQVDKDKQFYECEIPKNITDKIEVNAKCNITGQMTKQAGTARFK